MIAERMLGDKEMFGAESVAFIKGHYDRRCDWISRLAYSFGTPNIVGIDNTCYIPSASARLMTYGFDGRPDFGGRPKCVLAWGAGGMPPVSPGARLIVVNTLRTEAAKKPTSGSSPDRPRTLPWPWVSCTSSSTRDFTTSILFKSGPSIRASQNPSGRVYPPEGF